MDDNLVVSRSFEEHLLHLGDVFMRISFETGWPLPEALEVPPFV